MACEDVTVFSDDLVVEAMAERVASSTVNVPISEKFVEQRDLLRSTNEGPCFGFSDECG